jgi:hypothetical protein
MKPEIGKNSLGESLPILTPKTANAFLVNGSIAHAESNPLPSGIYRISVRTSTDNAGVMVKIYTTTVDTATTSTGMFMAHNSSEVFPLEEGSIISVIDGIINVTPLM